MLAEHLIVCGGLPTAGCDADSLLSLATGAAGNVEIRISDVSRKLVSNLPDEVPDLIEIASYIFCADQATSRGGPYFRGMGSDWRRHLEFRIPVRHPERWQSTARLAALKSMLEFLSDDRFEFVFTKAADPPSLPEYLDYGSEPGPADFDEVVLFSGGLDSLAGVLDRLHEGNGRLLLVSHRSSSKILDRQRQLVAELKSRFPDRIMHIPVRVNRREDLEVREFTQRTRSFLYAAIACCIAHVVGIQQVSFFENGVVSVNLPLSEQEVGARATRTTHPRTLRFFNEFFGTVFGGGLNVINPFIWKTKAEIVQRIVDLGHGDLIAHTVSCSHVHQMTSAHPHCGRCSQCIDRRFAILVAGATPHDPDDYYAVDLFEGPRLAPEDRTMAERYTALAIDMADATENDFMNRFGGEASRVLLGFPDQASEVTFKHLRELHRRHWKGVQQAAESTVAANAGRFVRGEIDPDSLLAMLVARKRPRQTQSSSRWMEEATAELEAQPRSLAVRERKTRDRPNREAAEKIIQQLYPQGVPSQSQLPNKILCGQVADRLRREVSNDTILRAAGRRRDRN